jgi:hypothetical protein
MPYFSPGYKTNLILRATKAITAEQFKKWWRYLPPKNITIFSDKSEQYKNS